MTGKGRTIRKGVCGLGETVPMLIGWLASPSMTARGYMLIAAYNGYIVVFDVVVDANPDRLLFRNS